LKTADLTSEIKFENKFEYFDLSADGSICLRAGGETNLFNNPDTRKNIRTAPIAWLSTLGNAFTFGATVKANLTSTFDAAGLIVESGNSWSAKFVHEMSPEGNRTIVSVVSSPFSDDANGPLAEYDCIKLRIANYGHMISMHWADTEYWHLARLVPRPDNQPLSIGIIAHSSLGTGCSASLSSLFLHTHVPGNLRNGE